MKPLYPLIGRITWMLSKRAAKQKLPAGPQKKTVVAGASLLALAAWAIAMLRSRPE